MLAAVARSLAGGTPYGTSFYRRLSTCPREHFHRVIEGLVPKDHRPRRGAEYMNNGSLFHATAAAYWEITRCLHRRPDPADVRSEFLAASEYIDVDPKNESDVWAAFTRWAAWERDPKVYGRWTPVAIEVPLEARYSVPLPWMERPVTFRLTAKADVVMRDPVGAFISVDSKFSAQERGSLDSKYLIALEIGTTLLCSRDGTVVSGADWPNMRSDIGLDSGGKDGATPGQKLGISSVLINNVINRTTPPPARACSVLMSDNLLNSFVISIARSIAIDRGDPRDKDTWIQRGLVTGACRSDGLCTYTDLCLDERSSVLFTSEE